MMTRRHPLLPAQLKILALLLGLLLAAGCGGDEGDPLAQSPVGGDDYENLNLDDEFGGLTASDEAVAFGDESLQAMLLEEDDELVDDPLADDPEVLALQERARNSHGEPEHRRPKFTYLRLRWGMLRGPEDTTAITPPCETVDWTGTIRTDRGIVVVKRVLAFERPVDHVIWPRLNPQTVAFQSFTGCHWDGLILQVIERPAAVDEGGEPVPPETPNMLHIELPHYEASFDVAELADLHLVEDVTAGTRIELTGFMLQDIEVCPKGFLSGRWRRLPTVTRADRPDTVDHGVRMGSYAGAWYSLDGRINGFLRGGYGEDGDGNRVFVGKAVDRRGRFHALIRGAWEPADGDDLASFRGEWVLASGRVDGVLGGEARPVEGYPGGFFTGRWTTTCDDEAVGTVMK